MATTAHRPRLSREFIQANQRTRLFAGFSKVVTEADYACVTVADIVRATGVARNTFYENFEGKSDLAVQLLHSVCREAELVTKSARDESVWIMAVEIAAVMRHGDQVRAADEIGWARQAVESIGALDPWAKPSDDDNDLAQLPPGRHGLPRDFVARNQRERLLYGTAGALAEYGWPGLTIERVCHLACVSRRTFYEHFHTSEGAVLALAADSALDPNWVPAEMVSGLAGLIVECLAELRLGERPEMRTTLASAALTALGDVA